MRRTGEPGQRRRWDTVAADIDIAPIGTIHALCAYILRSQPAEAGIDPEFHVLDEGQAAVWRARSVEEALGFLVVCEIQSVGGAVERATIWCGRSRLDVEEDQHASRR